MVTNDYFTSQSSKRFFSVSLILVCIVSLFIPLYSINTLRTTPYEKSHAHTHKNSASDIEHSDSNEHVISFFHSFDCAVSLNSIVFILPFIAIRIWVGSFLIPLKINSFSIFRPPKFSFSI